MKLLNNINFFKKHLVAIINIITFLIGSVIIGFYQGRNEIKKAIKDPNSELFQQIQTTKDIEKLITSREGIRKKLSDISSNPLCREDFKKEILEILSNNNCSKEDISNVYSKASIFNHFSKKEQVDFLEKQYIKKLRENIENLTNKYNQLPNDFLYKKNISQTNFQKIKDYVSEENEIQTLLPNDLSKQETTEITKIQNSWKSSLGYLKKEQDVINEYSNIINEHHNQINSIKSPYPSLKSQKEQLEKQLEITQIAKQKIEELLEITTDKTEEQKLKKQIKRTLRKENLELLNKISCIKRDIAHLEHDQRYYESILSRAKNFKKILEEQYKVNEKQYQDDILSKLNSLYQITSAEG